MICTKCGEEKAVDDFYMSGERRSTWCKSCHVARSTERTRARRQTPEGRAAHNEWSRRSERRRKLRRHGVPEDQIEALIEEAETGTCHACGRLAAELTIPNPSAKRLHVDHDHKTNLYRGLLCQPCNSALGLVNDDPDRLIALALYLTRTADLELMR